MLKHCFFSALFLFTISLANSANKNEWIFDFFNSQNIGSINFFGCTVEDSMSFLRFDSTKGLKDSSLIKTNYKNVLNIYPQFIPKHYQTGAFFDFNCDSSRDHFLEVSKVGLLNLSFVYVITTESFDSAIQTLKNSTIAFDSNIFIAVNGSLFDVYRIQPDWDLIYNYVGSYYDSINLNFDILNKRYNLNGTKISSSLVLMQLPFDGSPEAVQRLLDSNFEPEAEVLSRSGYNIHVLLEPVFNFRHELKILKEWGAYNETSGHWTPESMFETFELGTSDIGLSISRIFTRRLDQVMFFPPSGSWRSCFIFKHPSTLTSLTALVKPFSFDSWLCVIASIFLCGVILSYMRKSTNESNKERSLAGNFLLALGTICQQGLIEDTKCLPSRILTTFFLIVGLLTYTFYGAAVVGFLLMESPRTINTIDKLQQSPLIKYSEDLQYLKTHFENPFSDKIAKTYEAIRGATPDQDRYINLYPGLEKVQKGGVALYSQDINMYNIIAETFKSSEICALAEVEVAFFGVATMIRKKSPFKEILYRGIIKLRESGTLQRVVKQWATDRPECLALKENTAVTLEATVIAHLIYASGLVIALSILFFEIFVKKKFKTKLFVPRKGIIRM